MVRRLAHMFSHGSREWLLQRFTALLMALYVVALGVALAVTQPAGFAAWQGMFAPLPMRCITLLFVLGLLLHAWIGVKDVLADYVHPAGLRGALQSACALALLAQGAWALMIVWGIPA